MVTNVLERLPNFFIVGAPRCATTTLYERLKRHPEIYMSPIKEPRYFASDIAYMRGANYYANTFFRKAEGHSVRGEANPRHLYDERVPGKDSRDPIGRRSPVRSDPARPDFARIFQLPISGRSGPGKVELRSCKGRKFEMTHITRKTTFVPMSNAENIHVRYFVTLRSLDATEYLSCSG